MNLPKRDKFGTIKYLYNRQWGQETFFRNQFTSCLVSRADQLFKKDLKGHFGCVNAIEFSYNGGEWIASGGDDRRILLWNVQKALSGRDSFSPIPMKGEHFSNIFCLCFDNENKKIFSGGNDEQVVVHDVTSGEALDVFRYDEAVYCICVDPNNSSVFATASDDGRIVVHDIRAPPSEEPFCLANYESAMHAVMYNPVDARLLVTANSKEGVGLWDIRKPRSCLLRYGGSLSQQSCMSVRFSQDGRRLVALRRRLPPVLYNIQSAQYVFQFDHPGYYNSCAMKTCCFAGNNDEYLLSGSDDHNVYMWKIPDSNSDGSWVGEAHLVMKGHRSLVNQVRYNVQNQLIISSGVEKVIKVWSPHRLPHSTTDHEDRTVYSHEEYINLVLRSGEIMTHDYTNQSTEEDPRMMAFFDSLVQRELEGWSTDDSMESNPEFYERFVQSDSPISPVPSVHDSDSDQSTYSPFTIAFASVMASQDHGAGSSGQESLQARIINAVSDQEAEERNNSQRLQPEASNTNARQDISESDANRSVTENGNRSTGIVEGDANRSVTENGNRSPEDEDSSGSNADQMENVENGYVPTPEPSVASTIAPQRDSDIENRSATPHDRMIERVLRSRNLVVETPSTSNNHTSDLPSTSSAAPDGGKPSIYDLIVKKRKEYLAGIDRLEKKAKNRQEKKKASLANLKKRLKLLKEIGSDSSSTSDNDSEEDSAYQKAVTRSLGHMREQQRQKASLEQLGRLRFLRSQISDSDSDAESLTPAAAMSHQLRSAARPHTQSHPPTSNGNTHINGFENPVETPLRRSEGYMDLTSVVANQSRNERDNTENNNLHPNERLQPDSDSSQLETNRSDINANSAIGESAAYSTITVTGSCESAVVQSSSSVTGPCESAVQPSSSAPNEQGDTEESESTWQNFKRFRNRVEKARRHYRKRKSSQDPNSSDDDT